MFWFIAYVSLVVLAHVVIFMERRYWRKATPLWQNCVLTLLGIFGWSIAPILILILLLFIGVFFSINNIPDWACFSVPLLALFAIATFNSPAGRFLYFFKKMRRRDTAYYNDLDGYIPPRNNDSKL